MAAKTCPICNKEHTRRGVTCSKQCATQKRLQTAADTPRTCIECKTQFYSKDGTSKYCNNPHFRICKICAKEFKVNKPTLSKKTPTCSSHCGAIYSHRNPQSKEKRKLNSLNKWGVEHPFQAAEIKDKIAASSNNTNTQFGTQKAKEAMLRIYGVENASQLEFVKKKKADTYHNNYTSKGIYPTHGAVSKLNLKWKTLLEETTGLSWELERFFDQVGRIDLCAENNGKIVAVEINPTATHNAYSNLVVCPAKRCKLPCTEHTIKRLQHFNRTKTMRELHGVSLTTVFDWMPQDKIISFIKAQLMLNERKFYAKQTTIIPLTQREANAFLKEHHMLGASRKQTYCYGIVYNDELLQVQTFSPLGKTDGKYEAKRLVTKNNVTVVGGVSKVTKHFIREVAPTKITAFSDLNLSYPDYDVTFNGFERVAVNSPQKCWSKGDRMILDKSAARQSADRLLGIANDSTTSIYPEDWSNEQVFLAEGWLPVWDCGMIRDEWRSENI